jgi:hypothetical protein
MRAALLAGVGRSIGARDQHVEEGPAIRACSPRLPIGRTGLGAWEVGCRPPHPLAPPRAQYQSRGAVTVPMAETAQELIAVLAAIRAEPPSYELVFPGDFAARIRAAGDVSFFVELVRTLTDSTLVSKMLSLAFYWKDMPYEIWRQILRELAGDAILMYQLRRVLSQVLAIDVAKMIEADPQVLARVHSNPRWQSAGGEWWEEITADLGLEYRTIWRRLAAEGAPMNVDVDAL